MSTCECGGELFADHVGDKDNRRAVLLCTSCWQVFPSDHVPRHLHAVPERERVDLS